LRETIEKKLRQAKQVQSAAHLPAPTGDFDLNPEVRDLYDAERKLRPAAVLLPLIERPGGLTMLFTQRTDHLKNHAGQVSFPGGRVEESDSDAIETALRETEEEIGLSRRFIDIAGQLEHYETGTGFRITPVVGFVRLGFELKIDPFEVADTFEVPLDFLIDPANHQRQSRVWQGKERQFYAMPYGDRLIWGATAGMIISFWRAIGDIK
jgi:8-oxo-dGTP pyrophosphatase MutT (NUDIX family)